MHPPAALDNPVPVSCGNDAADAALPTLIRVLEEFRTLDPDLPIQYALSFLTLAQNEGLSMGELAQRLAIAQSSASRNIAALSDWHSFGKPGLGLVEAREDPRERRRKLVSLTAKGHAFLHRLTALMVGHSLPDAAVSAQPTMMALDTRAPVAHLG
ncbi:MAG: MarR family winged helix-turn-helix transcriptional regulator [Elstera sp.]|jgi:DNA-binding MarR family transcriptional regulator|uniref:MarR family winged helix-turn-helix transcriptional regulator n=1 Tax=Elstera sp. TaxID=1916664 RepID=UPI0037BF3704